MKAHTHASIQHCARLMSIAFRSLENSFSRQVEDVVVRVAPAMNLTRLKESVQSPPTRVGVVDQEKCESLQHDKMRLNLF